jgi:hypothetical protein
MSHIVVAVRHIVPHISFISYAVSEAQRIGKFKFMQKCIKYECCNEDTLADALENGYDVVDELISQIQHNIMLGFRFWLSGQSTAFLIETICVGRVEVTSYDHLHKTSIVKKICKWVEN